MEEGLSQLDQILINVAYILGIIIFIFMWLMFLRARYAKLVIGRVLCEFITSEGNGYIKLLKVDEGQLIIPPKGVKQGRQYPIADIATYTVDYPAVPRFLSIIQTKVKKAVFDEDCWEPLSNRSGKLLLSPKRLYNVVNERFTQVGIEKSYSESEGGKIIKNTFSLKPGTMMYIVIGILAIGLIILGIYVMKNFNMLSEVPPIPPGL